MRTVTKRAAAPGYATAAKRNRCSLRGCPATNRLSCVERFSKDTEDSSNGQLSLFDESGEPTSTREEMTDLFDRLRPMVAGLNPADRLSVISGAYWVLAGEDVETITGLLRKPLRGIFSDIIEKLKTK